MATHRKGAREAFEAIGVDTPADTDVEVGVFGRQVLVGRVGGTVVLLLEPVAGPAPATISTRSLSAITDSIPDPRPPRPNFASR